MMKLIYKINDEFETKSDEDSDDEKNLQEKGAKNLSQGKQKWYIRNGEMMGEYIFQGEKSMPLGSKRST